ncbi:SEC-C metal-binding domain-containing protein [Simkania sp.]|uniref:SEC-C metal-binding domain-containing protein n=1 Tax=Simkania sp. TaxID=34094 RepID=UPI003B51EDE3
MSKVGRNDPCPCGSGKKYKKCCEQKSAVQRRSFTNLTPQNVKTGMEKISGMVSKKLGGHTISEVQTEAPSLAERFSSAPPAKEKVEEKTQIAEKEEESQPTSSDE